MSGIWILLISSAEIMKTCYWNSCILCVHTTHTLVWSDFHFFRFLKMGTLLSIVYIIFMSSFLKNRRISFSFSKIIDTLKIYFFFNFRLSEPFLLQKRTIVKNRIQNLNLFSILFYFSKMAKTVFDLKNSLS